MKDTLTTLDILRDARDSGLFRKAGQALYYHLALRANQRTDYSTFVGYETLCSDTGLNAKTIQEAAVQLEAAGLISRKVRPNHSNVWYLNVWKVHKVAETRREAPVNPFAPDTSTADAPDKAPDAEFTAKRSAEEQEWVAEIHALIKKLLGEHPTYALANAKSIMDSRVEEMIDMAGSAKRCHEALVRTLNIDRTRLATLKSKQLGGYLKKCFPQWFAEWSSHHDDTLDSALRTLCLGGPVIGVCPTSVFYDCFPPFVHEKLGKHLIDLRETDIDGKTRYEADVTPQARITGIIAQAANEYLSSPDAIPEWADEEIVVDLKRMLVDEDFRSALKESEDSIGYCMDRLKRSVPAPTSYDLADELE